MKVFVNNLAIFFLFPSFCRYHSKYSCCKLLTKNKRKKQLGADKLVTTQILKLMNLMSLFSDVFSLLYIFNSLPSALTVYILPSSSLFKYKNKYKYKYKYIS